jgi:predicted nucleic acid-binding protein
MYVDTSLAFAAELKLRTLDLLHVAHLLALKEGGSHVEALATADRDFLRAEKHLALRGVKVAVMGA